ncbi:unnamed protein product [Amoebophrya sp. A25]|nr:unnamed protein product [Amoebophrya sp. A25]|eukprot:GSA25T00012021001.1
MDQKELIKKVTAYEKTLLRKADPKMKPYKDSLQKVWDIFCRLEISGLQFPLGCSKPDKVGKISHMKRQKTKAS